MIRKANLADVNFLNAIGKQYNSNFANLFHLETEMAKNFAIILVYEEKDILGFLYALDFGDNIDLLYIITEQNHYQQGVANALLKYLVDNYQVNNQTITLEVAVNNAKALKLYQKFNFYEVNRRKGYYNGVDAIIMRRD